MMMMVMVMTMMMMMMILLWDPLGTSPQGDAGWWMIVFSERAGWRTTGGGPWVGVDPHRGDPRVSTPGLIRIDSGLILGGGSFGGVGRVAAISVSDTCRVQRTAQIVGMTEVALKRIRWMTASELHSWIYHHFLHIEIQDVELVWRSQMRWRHHHTISGIKRYRVVLTYTEDISAELLELSYFH